jgi:hypothetical protein
MTIAQQIATKYFTLLAERKAEYEKNEGSPKWESLSKQTHKIKMALVKLQLVDESVRTIIESNGIGGDKWIQEIANA